MVLARPLPDFSLDDAMRSINTNKRVIQILQRYLANASEEDIHHVTFVLGEEDHNLLLLAMVEKAIQERAAQLKLTNPPSLIASQEFIEAAKAWTSQQKNVARLNTVQELIYSLLENKYPPESKINIVKAYLATHGKKEIPDSVKKEIANLPGAMELFSERKKPLLSSKHSDLNSKENILDKTLEENHRTDNSEAKRPRG